MDSPCGAVFVAAVHPSRVRHSRPFLHLPFHSQLLVCAIPWSSVESIGPCSTILKISVLL
eukprot:m.206840 g.206840  ORF g.206840 m.206840 type:complete len:60 (-) comp25368_c0_seq1:33-212(-)